MKNAVCFSYSMVYQIIRKMNGKVTLSWRFALKSSAEASLFKQLGIETATLGMCPDQRSNPQHFSVRDGMMLQPTESELLCNSVSNDNKDDCNKTSSVFSRPLYYILLLFLQCLRHFCIFNKCFCATSSLIKTDYNLR